jgi:hypothetical protein
MTTYDIIEEIEHDMRLAKKNNNHVAYLGATLLMRDALGWLTKSPAEFTAAVLAISDAE